jgi:mannosyltransferase
MAVVVAGAAALAAGLMLHSLAGRSLWIDEALSVSYARQPLPDLFSFFMHGEMNMALFHLLMHFWLNVSASEDGIRALSVAFGVATIPLAYLVAARLCSPAAGGVAAIGFALNGVFVGYAREARSYALVVFLVVAAAYFAVRAHEDDRTAWWVGYAISMALALYAHFFAFFVLAAHMAALLVTAPTGRQRLKAIATTVAVLVLATPIFAYLAGGHTELTNETTPSLADVPHLFEWYAGNNRPLLFVYLLATVAAVALDARGARSDPAQRWPLVFLLNWLTLPIFAALIVSFTIDPLFQPRYFLISLPALIFLAAIGIVRLRPIALAIVVAALLAATSTRSLVLCHGACGLPTQDFRGVEVFVASHALSGDRIIFDPPYLRAAYDYYATRHHHQQQMPREDTSASSVASRTWLLEDLGDRNRQRYISTLRTLRSDNRLQDEYRFRLLALSLYARRHK